MFLSISRTMVGYQRQDDPWYSTCGLRNIAWWQSEIASIITPGCQRLLRISLLKCWNSVSTKTEVLGCWRFLRVLSTVRFKTHRPSAWLDGHMYKAGRYQEHDSLLWSAMQKKFALVKHVLLSDGKKPLMRKGRFICAITRSFSGPVSCMCYSLEVC